jgi:hypothetical protein
MADAASVKGQARFLCSSKIRGDDRWYKEVDVSVPFVANEEAKATVDRLTKEAKKMSISCYHKQFIRLSLDPPLVAPEKKAK